MSKKNIPYIEETYDVVVVGAGHAGCEAALACARLGLETMMFTVSVDSIALMPCNPNIGGSSKGHLVREIDALGGEMGKNIDKTFIQSKMLNKSKGPAVHSLRAQADKAEYTKEMRKTLQNTDHLSIRQAEVAEILTNKDQFFPEDEYHEGEEQKITGVRTVSGGVYRCKAVVLCTGTYLRARCLTGEMITHPVMKDDTDLGLAVRWALAHGYRRLVMAGALGGRLDQTIASLQTLRGLTDAGAQGWLIGCGWVVTAVQNGTLAFPAGMEGTVSVFSSGDAARGVTLRGLLYEITDAELRCAMPLGVSNSFTGAAATVRVTDGTVFVLWQGNALPDGLEVRHGAD